MAIKKLSLRLTAMTALDSVGQDIRAFLSGRRRTGAGWRWSHDLVIVHCIDFHSDLLRVFSLADSFPIAASVVDFVNVL